MNVAPLCTGQPSLVESGGTPLPGQGFLSPSLVFHLFMDISTVSWGCPFLLYTVGERWLPGDSNLHINILELREVGNALTYFLLILQGHMAVIYSAASTALTYFRFKGASNQGA